jgi:hypothetical protein
MKIEKFEDWFDYDALIYIGGDHRVVWDYQQAKINHILEYISLIGHQKELDRFLNNKEEDDIPRRNNGMPKV